MHCVVLLLIACFCVPVQAKLVARARANIKASNRELLEGRNVDMRVCNVMDGEHWTLGFPPFGCRRAQCSLVLKVSSQKV